MAVAVAVVDDGMWRVVEPVVFELDRAHGLKNDEEEEEEEEEEARG